MQEDHTDLTVRIGSGSIVTIPAGIEVAIYDGAPAAGDGLVGGMLAAAALASGTQIDTAVTTQPLGPGTYEDITIKYPAGSASASGLGMGRSNQCLRRIR